MRRALVVLALLTLVGCGAETDSTEDMKKAKDAAKEACTGELNYPIYSTEWENCVEDYTTIYYDRRNQ